MAIPRTDRGPLSHTSTSGTGQTATSSPFTPTQGRVLVVAGAILTGNNSADLTVTDTFGAAVGPWTIIKTSAAIAYSTPSTRAFVAWAYVSGSPGSGTVSVVRTNSGSTECFIGATVLEFSDIDP